MDNELRCSRELAIKLGAISPANAAEHRALKSLGHLLIRDEDQQALLWASQLGKFARAVEITKRSS